MDKEADKEPVKRPNIRRQEAPSISDLDGQKAEIIDLLRKMLTCLQEIQKNTFPGH